MVGTWCRFFTRCIASSPSSLHEGQIPLWNPHQYAGTPLIADNQAGIFYPVNLVLFLLRPSFGYQALEALVVGHVWLAGAGMYACLRLYRPARRLRPGPALLGALVFMFSDVFVIHAGNLNLIAVAAWLPLIFLAFHRALLADPWRVRLAWAAGSGALTGIAALAGHGQMTFIGACLPGQLRALLARGGARLAGPAPAGDRRRDRRRRRGHQPAAGSHC